MNDVRKTGERNVPQFNGPLFGSDLIAHALHEQKFPYICLNPGASYRGLHDSLVNFLGNKTPQIIMCLHEEHAVGIAQGYAKVTDTPLAVAVHSNVGLMHATMGIFNAWCDRTPVVVIGATGPIDAAKRRPWIEWIHTAADQGALVRGYTKWDDQPGSPLAAIESIRRATSLAKARPNGPVYVNLDVAIQEVPVEEWPTLDDASLFATPADAEPPRANMERAAELLAGAEKPFIFCGRASRSQEGWRDRVRLAELTGARVVTHQKLPASFPSSHPAFLGETGWRLKGEILKRLHESDVVLMLDWLDAGNAGRLAFPPGKPRPQIISVSNDYQIHRGWSMDYGALPAVEVNIPTVPEVAVRQLVEALEPRNSSRQAAELAWPDVETPSGSGEIGLMDMARTFAAVTRGEKMCITGRPLGWPANANRIEDPHDFLGHTGGGGLGAGPSIAVGAALALRDLGSERIAVAILGDGDYLMGVTALWNAANLRLPILFLVANNHSYFNDENHQKHIAKHRDRPPENAPVGQRMEDPVPDLVTIARGQGLQGEGPITDLADLSGAIERAIECVRQGDAYVLDVHVHPEYIGAAMIELT